MFDELTELYQQTILDHNKRPRNFAKMPDADRSAEGKNPLCGDRFAVYVKIKEGVIGDISFHGSGCAISKASASAMTEAVKGRTAVEAQKLFAAYRSMILENLAAPAELGALAPFAAVRKFPARVKCALLPWHAAIAAIDGHKQTVSTEDRL